MRSRDVLTSYDPTRPTAEAAPADTDGRGARVHRTRRARFVAQRCAPPHRAAQPCDGPQRDGGPGRGGISVPAAHLRRARADGSGVPIFRGAGCGAGDGQSRGPAMDSPGTGIRADARSGDGASEPRAGGGFARAGNFYFAAAGAQRCGARAIFAAAGRPRAGGAGHQAAVRRATR